MARQRGARFETLQIKNFGSVDLRLDKRDGHFLADVLGQSLEYKTKDELVERIKQLVEVSQSVEWIGVIEISGLAASDHQDSGTAQVTLSFERYWVARQNDGTWIQSNWDNASRVEGYQQAQARDLRSLHSRSAYHKYTDLDQPWKARKVERYATNANTIYRTYSEALWATLQALAGRIKILDAELSRVLGTPELLAKLQAGELRLLEPPAPSDDAEA